MVSLNAAKWHKPNFDSKSEIFAVTFCFAFAPSGRQKRVESRASELFIKSEAGDAWGKAAKSSTSERKFGGKKVFSSFSTHTQAKRGFDFAGWCVLYGFQLRLYGCSKGINLPTFINELVQLHVKPPPRVTNRLPNFTRRYQKELPKKIKQRGRDAHLIHEELVQCMKWKQSVSRHQELPRTSILTICVLLAWQVLPAAVISDQSEHTARSGDGNKEGIP